MDQQIREYADEKAFHAVTRERWLSWNEPDKEALLKIARLLKIGENNVREIMDWLEEISLRDGVAICDFLQSDSMHEITTDPRLGRADKVKRLKEQIRRLRFPKLARVEDLLKERIRELKLQPYIKLSVPPGLEGGFLQFEFQASNYDELDRLLVRLREAAQNPAMTEIFALLHGRSPEGV